MTRRLGRRPWLVACIALVTTAASVVATADETEDSAEARAIVEHADRANTPPAMIETARMVIRDEAGATFERRLRVWSRQQDDGDLDLMRFLGPDEIRGAGLLTHEHRGDDDEQWFYLPATRKIRRIAGADRRNRFMGTELFYQDLQGFHPEDYRYRLAGEETVGGEPCRVVEAVPRPEKADRSAYGSEVLWIGESTALLRQARMFDAAGEPLKELATARVEEVAEGVYLPDWIEIRNVQSGRATSIETLERELPDALAESLFSQRELRRRLRPDER